MLSSSRSKDSDERYNVAMADHDRAAMYADRILDRILNVARGILLSNSLVLAIIATLQKANDLPRIDFIFWVSAMITATSSLILLYQIFLAEFEYYANDWSYENELKATVSLRKKIMIIRHSTFLSMAGFFFCCFSIAMPYFYHLFKNAYIFWIAA